MQPDYLNAEQGSDEWRLARLGKVTASRVAVVMKNGEARKTYMRELLAERLTGQPAETYLSAAMQNGTELESIARSEYEIRHETMVGTCGFIDHPTIVGFGCSPDGLLESDGLLEIKCPQAKAHLETIISDEIPDAYQWQMLAQMAVTGRSWSYYVSYNDKLPPHLEYYEKCLLRDDDRIDQMLEKIKEFLAELNHLETKLRSVPHE